ncbi:MAG: efflux RND transporter periplasmic adaptor subunit [Chitinophagaceae bacterium]
MKKFKWLIWILIIALAGVGIWAWKFREVEEPIVLETVHPEQGDISTSITATGTVQPVDTVAVGTQVSGTIKKVYADFNSTVKKGQLLAQLDKSLLLAQVQQFNAALQQSKSNLVYQQSNYERQKQLYDVGAISKADMETATNQYNLAKDNVTSSGAQLQSAQKNLSYSDIYSPIDGTVLTRNVSEGQTVASSFSTPTLFSIAKDLTKMQVRAAIDEADIGNVQTGQKATFTVDAFPDKTFEGTVKEIRLQAAVSANVVTYVTIIDAPNDDMKLKPGMTASITVFTKDIPDALIIPAKAVSFKPDSVLAKKYTIEGPVHKQGGNKDESKQSVASQHRDKQAKNDSIQHAIVWVKQDSSIVAKHITTGLNNETEVQVISGLTANDLVVTGYQSLKKGAAKKTTEKSPFLPQRTGGNRKTSGGGAPPR